jgi:GDP-L-fucose synthase
VHKNERIYVAGHRGLVGAAIVRRLKELGYADLVTATSQELDLREQAEVREFMRTHRPDRVFLAAARVGGILANQARPADFIRDNLQIQTNVIEEARLAGTAKLLFLGSSCIYPKHAPQPMSEDVLLTGPLEPTNQWYAVAKIAGIKLCQALHIQHGFNAVSAMPTNLYGPGDNFDLETSHVIPALIRKFHEAKVSGAGSCTVWGSGSPRREFLHVDDLACALVHIMEHYDSPELINVGVGHDVTIAGLAEAIRDVVGFGGKIVYDTDKPDGTPRKLLDVSRLSRLGWEPSITLKDGLARTYRWYERNVAG